MIGRLSRTRAVIELAGRDLILILHEEDDGDVASERFEVKWRHASWCVVATDDEEIARSIFQALAEKLALEHLLHMDR